MIDGATMVGTPIGRPCHSCGEVIIRGDRGLVLPQAAAPDAAGAVQPTVAYVHAECHLDDVAGHIVGLCTCRNVPKTRDRALQVWGHFFTAEGRQCPTPMH